MKLTKIMSALLISSVISLSINADDKLNDKAYMDKVSYAIGLHYAAQIKQKLDDEQVGINYNQKKFLDAVNDYFKDQDKTSEIDKISHALGVQYAAQTKQNLDSDKMKVEYNQEKFLLAFNDYFNNKTNITEQEAKATVKDFEQEFVKQEPKIMAKLIAEEEKKGIAYRENYAKEKDVKKTTSGVLYKIIQEGSGEEIVKGKDILVKLEGTTVGNDQVFVSSEKGKTVRISLEGELIPKGFIEAVKLIKKGGKIEFVLPPELAYGDKGLGSIVLPKSTLKYVVNLVDIVNKLPQQTNDKKTNEPIKLDIKTKK